MFNYLLHFHIRYVKFISSLLTVVNDFYSEMSNMIFSNAFSTWLRRDAKFLLFNTIIISLYGLLLIQIDQWIALPFLETDEFLVFTCIPLIYTVFYYSRITYLCMLLITVMVSAVTLLFLDIYNYFQSFQTLIIILIIFLCLGEILYRTLIKRQKAEDALRESEERYRTVIENTDDFVWQINMDGIITFASAAVKHLFGYEQGELLGKPFQILLNEESAQKAIESLEQRKRGELGDQSQIFELIHRHKDGTELVAEVRSRPIIDDSRQVTEIVGISRDITERKRIEKALRESEERFRSLFDNAPLGYQSLDNNGNFIELNESWCNLLGYTKEEVIGKNFSEFIHPDFREIFLENFPKSRNIGYILGVEFEMIKKDGSEIIVAFDGKIGYNNDGSFKQTHCVLSDITNKKTDQEKIKQQQYYLEKGQELGQIGTWELDLIRNKLYWTDENCKIFGVQPGSVVNYEIFIDKIHFDDREYVNSEWQAALDGKPYDIDHRLLIDGAIKWVREKADIEFNEKGTAVKAIGFTQDITARKNAEDALRVSEEMFRSTVNDLLVGVIVHAADSSIILSNQQAHRILGLSRDQLQGKMAIDPAWNFVHEDMSVVKIEDYPISQVIDSNERLVDHILGIKKPDCEDITWVTFNAVPVFTSDNVLNRVIINFMDITERKRAEKELLKARKLESIGILAGGIAHDFNNLLMAIIGNISLARTLSDSPEEVEESLRDMEIASQRAQKLTQQLLTFSKGGAPVKESANILEIIKETAIFSLRGSNISCNYDFPDNLWQVEVDKGQFSQVVQNLVINADQAMSDGGTIDVKGENISISNNDANYKATLQGDYVKISIKDCGTGIPEENLEKIFDRYFSTKQHGNGLGLATTYSIIKNHGGHIAVESQTGIGTTFTLYLPRSSKNNIAASESEQNTAISGHGRILIMDDEATIRKIVGRMLTNIGYQVAYAKDGAEAIEKYARDMQSDLPYDAIIMDLTIPGGMGGKEAIQKLLEIDPKIKAFVSSGYSGDPVMANHKKYGFTGVISKPYLIEELSQKLQNAL